jgi:septum formation topological specificity factor MinE
MNIFDKQRLYVFIKQERRGKDAHALPKIMADILW